ncbi:hypothetical protein BDZ89DRAFT_1138765 [Hymenopellis radicata]|nr:hypothetical protein BDZ89DRAFT_1138765 [Hymenopellis radicata]
MAKMNAPLLKHKEAVKKRRNAVVRGSLRVKIRRKIAAKGSEPLEEPVVYDSHDRRYLLRCCRPPLPLLQPDNNYKKLQANAETYVKTLIKNIHEFAIEVKTDCTLAEHSRQADDYMKAGPTHRSDILTEADTVADKIFAHMPVIPFTTMVKSSDNQLMFLFVGLRPDKKRKLTLEKFSKCHTITAKYVARSQNRYYSDRLPARDVQRLWIAMQSFAAVVPPEPMPKESKRHRDDWSLFSSHIYKDLVDKAEWRAVYHIMHCWSQKGHAKASTPMTPSGASSATTHVAQVAFIERTQVVTSIASALYQEFWKKEYTGALKTFKAGRFFSEDRGPWLGRALGYKVPTTTHPDEGDTGPTFLTCAGSFNGGHLQFHELRIQFGYQPGDMTLGYFGRFFHRVSAWSGTKPVENSAAAQAMKRYNLTPGRMFLVLFNKAETAARLDKKSNDWGRQTCFGLQQFASS